MDKIEWGVGRCGSVWGGCGRIDGCASTLLSMP